ncbi:hypothetical protein JX266_005512 [Neoarthrinium moseri]|nr:hypothetical protein JX266_005512 [Neoarthrinium moseri]
MASIESPDNSKGFEPRFEVLGTVRYEVEDVEYYKFGGFQPAHMGAKFGGRFEIVHKLSYGGIAIVWLCRDHHKTRWSARKIIAANRSGDDCPEMKVEEMFKAK